MRSIAAALGAASLILALSAAAARAEVRRIVVDGTGPAHGGAAIGAAGPYEAVRGRVFGDLDPADPRSAVIQDIALAPRNAAGRVEYVSTFTAMRPVDPARRTGGLIYQVVNRGNTTLADASVFHPGATLIESGWQGDLLANCAAEYPCTSLAQPWANERLQVLQVPVAREADGATITGPVFGRILDTSGSTGRLVVFRTPLPYKAVTLDTAAATLRSIGGETIEGRQNDVRTVPSADWRWADCTETPFPGRPDPTRICLRDGFDPARSYEVTFPARDPLVLGIGFAAVRDLVSFLRDERSSANPLAGEVRWTLIRGTSQSGNFVKSLLHNGFNESEAGRRVFDGAWPHIAARQNPLNFRFALPDGATNLYEPGSEGVLWWTRHEDAARGRGTGSLLARCETSGTCPRIFETFGANEVWYLRLTPGLLGTDARRDLPLPANVRRYYFPGTGHGGGRGGMQHAGAKAEGCALPGNPNPEADTNRALLDAMVAWITEDREPPPSAYPRLDRGEFRPATRDGLGFAAIPGVEFRDDLLNPLLDYDFGDRFDYADLRGVITRQPPAIRRVIPLLAVRVDADNNEVAGVPSVLHQAPLGTYLGWNVTAAGFRRGMICGLAGGYVPFAGTRAERERAGDSRASLQERYGTREGHVCAVRAAAARSVAARFLRPEEEAALVTQARNSDVLAGVSPEPADEARARALCAAVGG